MKKNLYTIITLAATFAFSILLVIPCPATATGSTPVTVKTFVRAETDIAIKKLYDTTGLNKFFHIRVPAPIDKQDVIRMNRDTIYSSAVLDLGKPVTVILPEAGGRYMNLHVINQDHYSFAVSKPGRHKLTEKNVGSRYAYLIVRTFVNADDPKDIKAANKAQDAMTIEGGGSGSLNLPDWNTEQVLEARAALNTLAKLGGNAAHAFGTKKEVNPIDHLVFAAAGWGGLPQKSAFYEISSVTKNDGTPYTVTVKEVPVNAFWSITVYNAEGFIAENPEGRYSFNNVTSKPNKDGSITINFGACDDDSVNCLPISKGWNYAVRMYDPRSEILDGSWKFPAIEPVK